MITHYTDSDSLTRLVRTLCGRLLNTDMEADALDFQHPTCPRCAALLAEREAEPLPAWAQAGLR
jgi:hypothetical protein